MKFVYPLATRSIMGLLEKETSNSGKTVRIQYNGLTLLHIRKHHNSSTLMWKIFIRLFQIHTIEEEYSITLYLRNILRFQKAKPWVKKRTYREIWYQHEMMRWNRDFWTCRSLYSRILNQLASVIEKNDIDLYQDNGLGIFLGISTLMIERKEKTNC